MGLPGFTDLKIVLDGDSAAADLQGRDDWQGGTISQFIMLEGGMVSGKPSVALRIECKDGSVVIAQTSWALMHAAIRAAEARYGVPS